MKSEKEVLLESIEEYAIILDDYINKRFKYTLNTVDLEDEIKAISACLLETIEDYNKILLEEEYDK